MRFGLLIVIWKYQVCKKNLAVIRTPWTLDRSKTEDKNNRPNTNFQASASDNILAAIERDEDVSDELDIEICKLGSSG